MRKTLFLFATLFCLLATPRAAHIIGGEMRYEYVGPGVAPNSKIFRIVMILFKGDATGPTVAPLADFYTIAIYNNDNNQKFPGTAGSTGDNWLINKISSNPNPSVPIIFPACIQDAPNLAYTYAIYSMQVELPNTLNGYTAVYQTCCRIDGLVNVSNGNGSTYNCSIPGTNQIGTSGDNSPQFGLPVNVICENAPFTLNFSAIDSNPGDSLVYSLCNAFNGGNAVNSGFDDPAPPPYASVSYVPPHNSSNPFGTSATINPQTGVITGIAPGFGKYVVCVCITIYRDGVIIAAHRKDLIVQVSDCSITASNPMPDFVTCDGFNVQFFHNSSGATSVFWDLGDPSTLADTANIDNPTYTYADTGTYFIKLIINRGTGCMDSAIRKIGVYPGFIPAFNSVGTCVTNPVQFFDASTATYGIVNGWTWNFGDLSSSADTSHIKNPSWTYSTPGPKDVTLISTSSKGCRDTITQTVTIVDKPPITLAFRDTLICIPDAVQLIASGTGAFSWTPLTNIANPNTATPTVNPTATTFYQVKLDQGGCINFDSVRVRVVGAVTIDEMNDTTICQTDTVQLRINSNGLQYQWTPIAAVNNPTVQNPVGISGNTTTYTVLARIGSCVATKSINVIAVPYPVANAGPDVTICYNKSALLHGSHDGSSFNWSPTTSLVDFNTLDPTAHPSQLTTAYVLSSYDTRGCPKPGHDTVVVTMMPKIRPFAGNDTMVIVNQPLQLNASGGDQYQWIPSTGLNNALIKNPVGKYGANIDSVRYTVLVFDAAGCVDSAHMTVRVFKTEPSVFVPTAFTPNNDGLNDVIRPIAVGIKQINYFSIYNRWGQLVFRTTINGHGWDGKIKGTPQGSNVFVWMVSVVDYLDRPLFLKGTVTLIR